MARLLLLMFFGTLFVHTLSRFLSAYIFLERLILEFGAAADFFVAQFHFQMSRVETPEPALRSHENMLSKQTVDNSGVVDNGKFKSRNGIRRQHSTKRTPADRKDKKVLPN